jgi:hypothetical protein
MANENRRTHKTSRASSEEICHLLSTLVGQPLSDIFHPLWQIFEFGAQVPSLNRKGEAITLGEFSLSLTSAWHVMRDSTAVIGSGDHMRGRKRKFYDRQSPPRDAEDRARWAEAKEFFSFVEAQELFAESISVPFNGCFEIRLSRGYAIRKFVDSARDEFFWLTDRRTDHSWEVLYERGQMVLTEFGPTERSLDAA